MLVLFIECRGRNLSIQTGVGKLNVDLHQLSRIRYESRSFSVRYLVSLAYRKGLISGVKLSIVVPQAIGISLRNNYALVIQWLWQTKWLRDFKLFVLHSSMDRMIWRTNNFPALASFFHFDNGCKLKFIGKLFPILYNICASHLY